MVKQKKQREQVRATPEATGACVRPLCTRAAAAPPGRKALVLRKAFLQMPLSNTAMAPKNVPTCAVCSWREARVKRPQAGVSPGTQDSRGLLADPVGDAALSPTEEPCSLRSGLSNSALKTSRAKAPRPAGSGVLSQQGGPAPPPGVGLNTGSCSGHAAFTFPLPGSRAPAQPRADTDLLHAAPASPRAHRGRVPPALPELCLPQASGSSLAWGVTTAARVCGPPGG